MKPLRFCLAALLALSLLAFSSLTVQSATPSATVTVGTRVTVDAILELTGVPTALDLGAGTPGVSLLAPPLSLNVLTNNASGYRLDALVNVVPSRGQVAEGLAYNLSLVNQGASTGGTWLWSFVVAGNTATASDGQDALLLTVPHRTGPSGDAWTINVSVVPPAQPSGVYTGTITFLATML